MRISDWSSDVCSSDLYDQTRQPILPAIIVAAQPAIVVVAAQLKNSLCQIHANHCIFRHGCRPFRSVALNTTFLAHCDAVRQGGNHPIRSEEHTSELHSLMRISYAVFCLNNKTQVTNQSLLSLHTLH